jgi:hypothetical protein
MVTHVAGKSTGARNCFVKSAVPPSWHSQVQPKSEIPAKSRFESGVWFSIFGAGANV